jgi:hypothetical protein
MVTMLISFDHLSAQQLQDPDTKSLSREEKKTLKKSKKEEENRARQEALSGYETIASEKAWVIEAHTVYNKGGGSFPMNPTTNFVRVNGDETTFQLAFNGIAGWNGIGGITLDGHVNKYVVSENKNAITISMLAMGPGMGPVDVLITVGPDGNGRATISGNWGERITFAGRFVPFEASRIFKGTPTY